MARFSKFGKIMAWLVMLGGITISIVLAVNFFMTASAMSSYSSYYGVAGGTKASMIWYGIGSLFIGTIFSVGNFVLWNMFISMYENSCAMKAKTFGEQIPAQMTYTQRPQQYAQPMQQPVQQPAQSENWICPHCNAVNFATSGFCTICGQQHR